MEYQNKNIVFFSLLNGVGATTIAYQVSRLLRLPLYQEQKNDLVAYLKSKPHLRKYPKAQITKQSHFKDGGVYDLISLDTKLINRATDIVVLTNNSYLDILKTITTLKQIALLLDTNINFKVHVLFNRLQNGSADREKKYTEVSKELIDSNNSGLEIHYSYIRTNLAYYKDIKDGKFFMSTFFKSNFRFLQMYKEVTATTHIDHLEHLFDYQYLNIKYDFSLMPYYQDIYIDYLQKAKIDIQKKIDNNTIENCSQEDKHILSKQLANNLISKVNYNNSHIKDSRVVIKDMFLFMYNLDIYSNYTGKYNKFIEDEY